MRTRLWLTELNDPFEPATARQLIVAVAVIGALLAWRVGS